MDDGYKGNQKLIPEFITKKQMKMLYFHAMASFIPDNNDKANVIRGILGNNFEELGTGTNRIAFLYNGFVVMVALDRRGMLDNFQEFKRSIEAPQYFIKVYECNMLILIEEYVTLMDEHEFRQNEAGIKQILTELDKAFIFEDIGFTLKNHENWGYRSNGDIVCLDLGYVYSRKGQEHLRTCPLCKGSLKYNSNFTKFICQNKGCNKTFETSEIMCRMDMTQMNLENRMIATLNNVEIPDLGEITFDLIDKYVDAFQ